MTQQIDYQRDTVDAYRSRARAEEYKRYNTTEWSWGRFVTGIEQRALKRELSRYAWSASDRLLDIPCGTGILGSRLREFPFQIVASDVSEAMMGLARAEYPPDRFLACVQADITCTSFRRASFACVVTLGFLHRVPPEIKRDALREIAAVCSRVAIVTCSVDTRLQRLKHRVLSILLPGRIPAPCPAPLSEIVAECEASGFRVRRAFLVLPWLSSEAILVLEKRSSGE